MQSIPVGSVWTLHPAIVSSNSKHDYQTGFTKKLSYMVGTISSRPVMVSRPPVPWDKFGTIEVVPALSDADPSIPVQLYDITGRLHRTIKLVPHLRQIIPIARLDNFLGILSTTEMDMVREALNWLNEDHSSWNDSPYFREDDAIELSTRYKHTALQRETIRVDVNNVISVKRELIGTACAIDDDYVEPNDVVLPSVESFSSISEQFISEYVNTAELSEIISKGLVHPDISNDVNVRKLFEGTASDRLYEIFNKLTIADILVIIPSIPTTKVSSVLQCSMVLASKIKRACLIVADNYHNMLQNTTGGSNTTNTDAVESVDISVVADDEATNDVGQFDGYSDEEINVIQTYPYSVREREIATMLDNVRKYLTERNIMNIPRQFMISFITIPPSDIMKVYIKNSPIETFDEVYNRAYRWYVSILADDN